jgi:hypothetical protein
VNLPDSLGGLTPLDDHQWALDQGIHRGGESGLT